MEQRQEIDTQAADRHLSGSHAGIAYSQRHNSAHQGVGVIAPSDLLIQSRMCQCLYSLVIFKKHSAEYDPQEKYWQFRLIVEALKCMETHAHTDQHEIASRY